MGIQRLTTLIVLGLLSWTLSSCGLRPMPPSSNTPGVSTNSTPVSESLDELLSDEPPQEASESVSRLARSLTAEAQSEREKAQALYRWLGENISYDVAALASGDLSHNDPDTVLRTRKAVCAGYADLFHVMSREVGLESKVIPGRSRSEDQAVPAAPDAGDSNHAWNAVKLEGRWHLLDPTWGAGYVDDQKQFVRQANDQWFMVEPEIFVYSHLPEEPKWQLLDSPIDRDQFERLPQIKPLFFEYGLELVEPTEQPINCAGELSFKVASSKGVAVTALVTEKGERLPPNLVFSQRRQDQYLVSVRLPRPGEYQVYLMGALPGEKESRDVASFEVHSSKGVDQSFPDTFLGFKESDSVLLEGFDRTLQAGRPAEFKLEVPGAKGLFLKNGEDHIPFQREGESFVLRHAPVAGVAQVFAQFEGQGNRLQGLLAYQAE